MLRLVLFAFCLLALLPREGRAEIPVDLELVLAIDCSSSVDDEEFALQVAGMANAFRDPMIQDAIQGGVEGAVGISVIQWSSDRFQNVAVRWRLLTGPADALKLADEIEAMPRTIGTGATSIANALLFAAETFNGNGMEGYRRVIDMSADGENNQGLDIHIARAQVLARGITINGLAIRNEFPNLDIYFEDRVIGGEQSFAEAAKDYVDYRNAIFRKLFRELRDVPVAVGPELDPSWKEASLLPLP
ncbi:DUF1194 domain-containing protein [Nisaea acidiphila]|uniref:DUF1194 domain-containing protein n=1 Tax=Nisaea acidiphila TaxID=1862145 RepID=A0A9J7ANF5_9PROT|nr:DUF1194 domain-containing protein [Nisaea acidiphila]UUX48694.1 DUF1194 domain-containing protein [Nisaea acidiphila]